MFGDRHFFSRFDSLQEAGQMGFGLEGPYGDGHFYRIGPFQLVVN
jgi:hypothetical protein